MSKKSCLSTASLLQERRDLMVLRCWRECQGPAGLESLIELHLLPIKDLFCSLLGPTK